MNAQWSGTLRCANTSRNAFFFVREIGDHSCDWLKSCSGKEGYIITLPPPPPTVAMEEFGKTVISCREPGPTIKKKDTYQ